MSYQTSITTQSENVTARVAKTHSRLSRNYPGLLASLGFASFLLVSAPAFAASSSVVAVAPALGTAAQFGVLGNAFVTGSTGSGTVVNGNVGSAPTAPTINNFGPSTVASPFVLYTAANAVTAQAHTDANAAYTSLAGQGLGYALGDNLSAPGVGVLTPGVYSSGAADLEASTTLTLNDPSSDKSGIFVFNVASTLTMNSSSVVNGNADPCNVYWRVGSSATLNGLSFMGTIIADTSITVSSASTVSGSLLAGAVTGSGAVTMAVGGNTIGGCSPAKLLLQKSVSGGAASASAWTLTATGPVTISGTTPMTAANAPKGVYTLTESGGPVGYLAGPFSCDAGSLSGNQLTIAGTDTGKTITCTIINTFNVPTLSKTFNPSSISAGGSSRLIITLTNNYATAATLTSALTDTLTGMTTVGSPTTTCGGTAPTVTASTVTLPSGATIPGGAPGTCTVAVNVTSAVIGSYTNTLVAGALVTSNGNNPAPATAILTVAGAAVATTLSSQASSSVAIGGTISDTATLSGGTTPTGTITFNLYAPSDTSCLAPPVFTSAKTIDGTGSYTSDAFTSAAIGTYHWIANYSGDANNAVTANTCTAANESVVVTAAAVTDIPTLSEWAMIMLAALLAIAGFAAIRRKER